jgi:hypothetical protein
MLNKNLFFFLACILLLGFVEAKNISVDYPEKITLNKEFKVTLQLVDFPEDTYDIKIDLTSNGERIAKILNGEEWKSTYYYVTNAINGSEQKDFLLKTGSEFEELLIEIKVRDSKEKVETFSGYKISDYEVEKEEEETTQQETSPNETKENTTNEELAEDDEEKSEDNSKEEINENIETELISNAKSETINLTPIKLNSVNSANSLNSKDIKSGDNKEILKRNLSFLGIISFCLLFGAWFLLNKRKNKNEFRQ